MKIIITFIAKNLVRLQRLHGKKENYKGFTIIEILVVLMIAGIMAAFAAPTIKFGINPLQDTTNRIAGNFKLVRAKAMSQTSAYRVRQTSATQLTVERARSCFDTTGWTVDPSFTVEDLSLAEAEDIQGLAKNEIIQIVAATVNGTTVTTLTNWRLCYDSRGLADRTLVLTLRNITTNRQNRIEVFRGGTVQTYEN